MNKQTKYIIKKNYTMVKRKKIYIQVYVCNIHIHSLQIKNGLTNALNIKIIIKQPQYWPKRCRLKPKLTMPTLLIHRPASSIVSIYPNYTVTISKQVIPCLNVYWTFANIPKDLYICTFIHCHSYGSTMSTSQNE